MKGILVMYYIFFRDKINGYGIWFKIILDMVYIWDKVKIVLILGK